jgi:hypothetical protein
MILTTTRRTTVSDRVPGPVTATQAAIITALAAKFGPHKAYNRETKTYEPDGNDAQGSCMISEQVETEDVWHMCGDDGPCDCMPFNRTETILRSLRYGEIAAALAPLAAHAAAAERARIWHLADAWDAAVPSPAPEDSGQVGDET